MPATSPRRRRHTAAQNTSTAGSRGQAASPRGRREGPAADTDTAAGPASPPGRTSMAPPRNWAKPATEPPLMPSRVADTAEPRQQPPWSQGRVMTETRCRREGGRVSRGCSSRRRPRRGACPPRSPDTPTGMPNGAASRPRCTSPESTNLASTHADPPFPHTDLPNSGEEHAAGHVHGAAGRREEGKEQSGWERMERRGGELMTSPPPSSLLAGFPAATPATARAG